MHYYDTGGFFGWLFVMIVGSLILAIHDYFTS